MRPPRNDQIEATFVSYPLMTLDSVFDLKYGSIGPASQLVRTFPDLSRFLPALQKTAVRGEVKERSSLQRVAWGLSWTRRPGLNGHAIRCQSTKDALSHSWIARQLFSLCLEAKLFLRGTFPDYRRRCSTFMLTLGHGNSIREQVPLHLDDRHSWRRRGRSVDRGDCLRARKGGRDASGCSLPLPRCRITCSRRAERPSPYR
jgi:hypothetical protein